MMFIRIATTMAAAIAAIATLSAPAMASDDYVECDVIPFHTTCSTATTSANPDGHYLDIGVYAAFPVSGCNFMVLDVDTHRSVASGYVGAHPRDLRVNGLYGRYYGVMTGSHPGCKLIISV